MRATILRRLCQEGLQLQSERETLSAHLSLSVEVSVGALSGLCCGHPDGGGVQLSSHRHTGTPSGSISRFSRSSSYSKADGVRTRRLDHLIAFRRKSEESSKQAEGSGFVRPVIIAPSTPNSNRSGRLAKYFEGISENFGKPEHAGIRSFLKEATASQLDLLPSVPQTGVPITFASLCDRIADEDREVLLLQTAIDELCPVVERVQEC